MFDFTDGTTVTEKCPHCKATTTIHIVESLNFGNLLAMCDGCDEQWDYTPIDHRAIRAEARRGFVYRP